MPPARADEIENVPPESTLSRGEPAEFVHNSAVGYGGGGAIDLAAIHHVGVVELNGRSA